MRPLARALSWSLLATACAANEGGCSTDDVIDVAVPADDPQPRRDTWRLELAAPFDAEVVSRVSIGGRTEFDNFANRGDVIVHFDGKPGQIEIEMRRFDFTRDAESRFERLQLWTHRLEAGLVPPPDSAPSACSDRWDDNCGVRVHYDGQVQPSRSGADLRVTLPPEFAGHVDIVTEDNVTAGYVTRSDVCMLGLRGSSDVQLESGHAWVSLDDDIRVTPQCTEEEELACMTTDPPWQDCPCLEEHGFGATLLAGTRANQLVSVPSELWAYTVAHARWPCEFGVDPARDGVPVGTLDLGYRVEARSEDCGLVEYFDSPAGWLADEDPESEQRGDVEICRGCIEAIRCEQLIP